MLDSFYLRLFLKKPKVLQMPSNVKLEKLWHEQNFFSALSKGQCSFLREPFRAALLVVLAGKEESADILTVQRGHLLRDRWVACVRRQIAKFERAKDEPRNYDDAANDPRPTDREHPEGEHGSRASSPPAPKASKQADDSDCSSTEIESFSDDDVDVEAVETKKQPEKQPKYKPLTLKRNTETQLQLRLLRKIRKPADITDRTAQWVADKFLFSSRYVMDMLQGDTPWPGWSRAQLFNVCNKISALYEQVELRERTAKELSESTRKEMLKSESRGLRDIRLMLNIARLGPGGERNTNKWS